MSESDVPFKLTDNLDMVVLGSKMLPLRQVIADRQKASPAGKNNVLYHEVKDHPVEGDAGYQTLTTKHIMVWRPASGATVTDKGQYTTMDHKSAAASVPTSKWDGTYSGVVWQVKWMMQGLAPVRPFILTIADIQVPPQKALCLF